MTEPTPSSDLVKLADIDSVDAETMIRALRDHAKEVRTSAKDELQEKREREFLSKQIHATYQTLAERTLNHIWAKCAARKPRGHVWTTTELNGGFKIQVCSVCGVSTNLTTLGERNWKWLWLKRKERVQVGSGAAEKYNLEQVRQLQTRLLSKDIEAGIVLREEAYLD